MKIDGNLVPACMLERWKLALASVDAAAMKDILQAYPHLTAGFRPGHINPSIALVRIKAALLTFPELPQEYRAFLRTASGLVSLIEGLDCDLLVRDAALLAKCFATGELFAAMLLDARLAVRSQGFALLANWDGSEPDPATRSASVEALRLQWQDLLGPLDLLNAQFRTDSAAPNTVLNTVPNTVPNSAVNAAPVQGALPSTLPLRAARPPQDGRQLLELREKRKELKALQRNFQSLTFERDAALAAKLAECRANEKSSAEVKRLNQQLSVLHAQLDTHVHQQVSARLSHRLLPWLRPAEAFADAVAQNVDTNLIARAQQLLDKQAAADRLFGLRSQLQDELSRLALMREKLRAAQLDSLHPLAELETLSGELAARITTIQSMLELKPVLPVPVSSAVDQFVLRLSSSISLDDIARLRQALQASESAGLLLDHELHSAYTMMGAATSRVYAQSSLSGGRPQLNPALKGLPLYAMEEALAHDRPCTLVVDGHNVLHKLGWLFRADFEQGLPGKRARQALTERLQALGLQRCGLMIHLWFDGPQLTEISASEHLQIHFSGGSGENRADQQIVAYLRHLQIAQPDMLRAVVTDDRDEAGQALQTGALAMAVQELALWIAG